MPCMLMYSVSSGRAAFLGYRAERSRMDELRALFEVNIAMETAAIPLCLQMYVGHSPLVKSSS